MDTENKVASCVGWIVAWLGLTVIAVAMDGWALSKIWNWFMPTIFSLPTLTIMQAVGVAMVFQLFTRNLKSPREQDEKSSLERLFIETAFVSVFTPLFTVGIAWIVLQFAF